MFKEIASNVARFLNKSSETKSNPTLIEEQPPYSDFPENSPSKEDEAEYPPRFKVVGRVPDPALENAPERLLRPRTSEVRGERTRSPEDINSINYLNQLGHKIGKKYSFKWVDVPPERVHFISLVELEKPLSSGKAGYAGYYPEIEIADIPSRLARAKTLFHEMIHVQSAYRVQYDTSRYSVSPYRALGYLKERRYGLYFSPEYPGFTALNEAVTEILTLEAMQLAELDVNSLFYAEALKVATLRAKLHNKEVDADHFWSDEVMRDIKNLLSQNAPGKDFQTYQQNSLKNKKRPALLKSYGEQREQYQELLELLLKRNSGKFNNTDEVHHLFVKAIIEGEILPVARLIETTFGEYPMSRDERGKRQTLFRQLGVQNLDWLLEREGSDRATMHNWIEELVEISRNSDEPVRFV